MAISAAASMPPSASGAQPDAVNMAVLKEAISSDQQMMATLLKSLAAPQAAGTGGNVNAYA